MKNKSFSVLYLSAILCLLVSNISFAQTISTEAWPPDTDFSKEVHFWSADGFLTSAIPANKGANYKESLSILNGGDQANEDVTVGGKAAKKADTQYMNLADSEFTIWPDVPVIDVLVLYFANAESINSDFGFLLGVIGNLKGLGGFTLESLADQYQWHIFRIDNSGQWTGNLSVVDPVPGGSDFGGVNGGTIRFERVTNLVVRAVAFGPEGAFGDPEKINQVTAVEFNPDNYPIVAEWNPSKAIKNGVDVYRDKGGDQEVVESDNIGPAGDKRKAARAAFDSGKDATRDTFMNWEILNEYFGPTSQPSTRVKIAVEYYDDPALTGTVFGPEAYKTTGGEIAFYPVEKRTTLAGTGKWQEAVYYATDVKFDGVNVPTQAAVRFTFDNGVYISRYRLGVIRSAGINKGIDPIPDTYPFDPDPYQNYGQLDINKDISEGIALGTSGGDQEYMTEEGIGPAGDKRKSIRPSLDQGTAPFDRYMNFAINDEWFGPSSQPNAVMKIAVDYYDDPALTGERFGPEVYQSNIAGTVGIKFFPDAQRLTVEGTDVWRTAVWQIDDVNFTGVNQGPQAAVRFWFTDACAVHISRVQYGIIRPKGAQAGKDPLAGLPVTPVPDWSIY